MVPEWGQKPIFSPRQQGPRTNNASAAWQCLFHSFPYFRPDSDTRSHGLGIRHAAERSRWSPCVTSIWPGTSLVTTETLSIYLQAGGSDDNGGVSMYLQYWRLRQDYWIYDDHALHSRPRVRPDIYTYISLLLLPPPSPINLATIHSRVSYRRRVCKRGSARVHRSAAPDLCMYTHGRY